MTDIKQQSGDGPKAKQQGGGRSKVKQRDQAIDGPQSIDDEQLDPVSGAGGGARMRCY